jgi:hypothetical protein
MVYGMLLGSKEADRMLVAAEYASPVAVYAARWVAPGGHSSAANFPDKAHFRECFRL